MINIARDIAFFCPLWVRGIFREREKKGKEKGDEFKIKTTRESKLPLFLLLKNGSKKRRKKKTDMQIITVNHGESNDENNLITARVMTIIAPRI